MKICRIFVDFSYVYLVDQCCQVTRPSLSLLGIIRASSCCVGRINTGPLGSDVRQYLVYDDCKDICT